MAALAAPSAAALTLPVSMRSLPRRAGATGGATYAAALAAGALRRRTMDGLFLGEDEDLRFLGVRCFSAEEESMSARAASRASMNVGSVISAAPPVQNNSIAVGQTPRVISATHTREAV